MNRHLTLIPFVMLLLGAASLWAQVDPFRRSLLHLGYDQPLSDRGPQSLYAYYYYNDPGFVNTNTALRLAVAPVYFDGEIAFRGLLSPHTDLGIGINGGGFGENHYEVRQGTYLKGESFDGHGGGASLRLYHLLNPSHEIPLSFVVQGGAHYSTFAASDKTDDQFEVPRDRVSTFVRTGLRFAGEEPTLYTDLTMEVSVPMDSPATGGSSRRRISTGCAPASATRGPIQETNSPLRSRWVVPNPPTGPARGGLAGFCRWYRSFP